MNLCTTLLVYYSTGDSTNKSRCSGIPFWTAKVCGFKCIRKYRFLVFEFVFGYKAHETWSRFLLHTVVTLGMEYVDHSALSCPSPAHGTTLGDYSVPVKWEPCCAEQPVTWSRDCVGEGERGISETYRSVINSPPHPVLSGDDSGDSSVHCYIQIQHQNFNWHPCAFGTGIPELRFSATVFSE